MKPFLKKYALVILVVSCMVTYQGTCRIDTADIVRALDNAIESLNQNSAEWQTIVNRLLADLDGFDSDLASLIRVEVQNLLDRGVAVIGSEFRCNVDFIGNRMRNSLLRLKQDYFNSDVLVPPLAPFVCTVVPSPIDRILIPDRLSVLEFYGYDFDLDNVNLYVQESNGTRENISEYLDKSTHYHMTVDLGTSGVELTAQHDKLVLIYNFEEIAIVKIIQGSTELDSFFPGSRTFVPPHTRGDTEFAGHGPEVTCRVELSIIGLENNMIQSRIEMSAVETGGDLTTAEGTDTHIIYTAPPGKKIKEISGITYDQFEYLDSNTTLDWFARGSGGPVSHYEFVGDSEGVDAGTDTRVTVEYNRLTVELTAP
jgi:hypothetical protein